jgi:uncharacterized protein (DUF1330 family)
VISEVEVLNEADAQRYRELASSSIARHGGAVPEAPEGEWRGSVRLVIVEFRSMRHARQWYASADYAEALAIRRTALERRLLFVPTHQGARSRHGRPATRGPPRPTFTIYPLARPHEASVSAAYSAAASRVNGRGAAEIPTS